MAKKKGSLTRNRTESFAEDPSTAFHFISPAYSYPPPPASPPPPEAGGTWGFGDPAPVEVLPRTFRSPSPAYQIYPPPKSITTSCPGSPRSERSIVDLPRRHSVTPPRAVSPSPPLMSLPHGFGSRPSSPFPTPIRQRSSSLSRPPTRAGLSVTTAHLQPTIVDPIMHTVVLVSSISATLSAHLQFSHQSLLDPVFRAFAERILKTKPDMVAYEVQARLKKYATGFNYDGIRRAREEMIQAFMHSWMQIGLDCATSAKETLSKDVSESITKQFRDQRATPTLCKTLSDAVKLAVHQCLARTNERIKELAQDHMVIVNTHDHQRLAFKANSVREQVFREVPVFRGVPVVREAPVPDNVRTVGSEVHAYFDISSGEFIDGCIRIILRQLMHQLSLQLSSELLGALKLSEAGLSERCRTWVE